MMEQYKEFCWYDGNGNYVVLDIDPSKATKEEMIAEASKFLQRFGFSEDRIEEQLSHCYIMTYSKNILEEKTWQKMK